MAELDLGVPRTQAVRRDWRPLNDRTLSSRPPRSRRVASAVVDALIFFIVPILWWHWSEWARYTSTFGRQLPSTIAMPIMALIPLTVLWIEAVTGRGAGKALLALRLQTIDGDWPSLGRRLLRSAIKWSPVWVGPAVWIFDAFTQGTRADDFTNDYLVSHALTLAEHLPEAGQRVIWAANVSLRGMNWGVIPLAVLALGHLMVLLRSRRSLLDRIVGTKVVSARSAAGQ